MKVIFACFAVKNLYPGYYLTLLIPDFLLVYNTNLCVFEGIFYTYKSNFLDTLITY